MIFILIILVYTRIIDEGPDYGTASQRHFRKCALDLVVGHTEKVENILMQLCYVVLVAFYGCG